MSDNRTLWEEGRYPARLVAVVSALAALVVVLLNLVGAGQIGLFFDLSFVLICVAAALAIRPTEFFVVGVLPPLLLAGTIFALALIDRSSVADPGDGLVQSVVSGLAHHATALAIGYALTLVLLAIRQVATRNQGKLVRQGSETHIPRQRTPERSRPPVAPPLQRRGTDKSPGKPKRYVI